MDVKKLFGATVRQKRHELGLSQEELAERADLHRTYVSDVERGSRNVSLENIERLAEALEVSVAALFPLEGSGHGHANGMKGNGKHLVDVLLVEDDANDADLTLHAFKKARFANRIHVVGDGMEALDYIFCQGKFSRRNPAQVPQLILLDLNLPTLDGFEVLRRIKADKRTRSIPVIVLTISQDEEDIAQSRRLGAESYIVKPVDFHGLIRATPELNLDWALLKPVKQKSDN